MLEEWCTPITSIAVMICYEEMELQESNEKKTNVVKLLFFNTVQIH